MVIAIDFDGTIVEDQFPEIGESKMFAFETLRALQKDRHQLLLWTRRTGNELLEAVEYCAKHGVEFYAVNNSFPEEKFDNTYSRKLNCEMFYSHRNVGELIGWGEMYQHVKEANGDSSLYVEHNIIKGGFLDKLKSLFN